MLRQSLRVPADVLNNVRGLSRQASAFFTVRVRRNGMEHPRFAVIVGVKVDSRSVVRNILKRRAVSFLLNLQNVPGRDIIVSVHPEARDLTREQFYLELGKILRNI